MRNPGLLRVVALVLLAVLVVGCTGDSVDTTTTMSTSTTTPTSTTATSAPEQLRTCPVAPYEIGFFPIDIDRDGFDPATTEPDVWTSAGGTHTTFYGRFDGSPAIAVVRGTLPAVDWPAERGETTVDGERAAVGPHLDGTWVAGWYVEPAERCDLYTMVFYPPWDPSDVEEVILSMTRVPG